MSGIPAKNIEGDVSVGRNVVAGGTATVRGSVKVGHNLRVDGWLDAPNISGPHKGIYATATLLSKAWPDPKPGWWGVVTDDNADPTRYVGRVWYVLNGKWKPAEGSGGTPVYAGGLEADVSRWLDEVDALGERADAEASTRKDAVEGLRKDVRDLTSDLDRECIERNRADTALGARITDAIDAAAQGDDALRRELTAEAGTRRAGDETLDRRINEVETGMGAGVREVREGLSDLRGEVRDLTSDLDRENRERVGAEAQLGARINDAIDDAAQGDDALRRQVNEEAAARRSADETLQSGLTAAEGEVSKCKTRIVEVDNKASQLRTDLDRFAEFTSVKFQVTESRLASLSDAHVGIWDELENVKEMIAHALTGEMEVLLGKLGYGREDIDDFMRMALYCNEWDIGIDDIRESAYCWEHREELKPATPFAKKRTIRVLPKWTEEMEASDRWENYLAMVREYFSTYEAKCYMPAISSEKPMDLRAHSKDLFNEIQFMGGMELTHCINPWSWSTEYEVWIPLTLKPVRITNPADIRVEFFHRNSKIDFRCNGKWQGRNFCSNMVDMKGIDLTGLESVARMFNMEVKYSSDCLNVGEFDLRPYQKAYGNHEIEGAFRNRILNGSTVCFNITGYNPFSGSELSQSKVIIKGEVKDYNLNFTVPNEDVAVLYLPDSEYLPSWEDFRKPAETNSNGEIIRPEQFYGLLRVKIPNLRGLYKKSYNICLYDVGENPEMGTLILYYRHPEGDMMYLPIKEGSDFTYDTATVCDTEELMRGMRCWYDRVSAGFAPVRVLFYRCKITEWFDEEFIAEMAEKGYSIVNTELG